MLLYSKEIEVSRSLSLKITQLVSGRNKDDFSLARFKGHILNHCTPDFWLRFGP